MEFTEEFQTISSSFETKFKEKGSIFIGQAYPVDSLQSAEIILADIRKKHYDATHHCYAISLVNRQIKYSDDGEPSGTAGIRILNAIQHFKLENILTVVVRYFGGVKLGVGPLGKAYYNSALNTITDAPKVIKTSYIKYKLIFDFPSASQVHHLLSLYQVKNIKTEYSEKTEIEFLIKYKNTEAFKKKMGELLRENVQFHESEDIIYL